MRSLQPYRFAEWVSHRLRVYGACQKPCKSRNLDRRAVAELSPVVEDPELEPQKIRTPKVVPDYGPRTILAPLQGANHGAIPGVFDHRATFCDRFAVGSHTQSLWRDPRSFGRSLRMTLPLSETWPNGALPPTAHIKKR